VTRDGRHYDPIVCRRLVLGIALAGLIVLGVSEAAQPAVPPALVCKLPRDSRATLPPTARHGIINHLLQYPAVSLATPRQRLRARLVLDRLEAADRKSTRLNSSHRL